LLPILKWVLIHNKENLPQVVAQTLY